MTTTNTTDSELSAGTIRRSFPIVAGKMKIGSREHVTYYGEHLVLVRTGAGEYDFIAEKSKINYR